jgi:protein SCO1/2
MALQPTSTEPPEPQPSGGFSLNWVLAGLVAIVVAGGIALLAVGKGSSSSTSPTAIQGAGGSAFAGSLASPPAPEAPLVLHNYQGQRVDIAQYKGRAVLVTFIYTHCPDVCPLIVANLRIAQELLGPRASQAQIVAVSVDPRGDTPQTVSTFLAAHRMTGRMQYLVGSARELGRVWKAWGVGSERDAKNPSFVEHTGLVYGVSASGKVTTLYAGNFKPAEIAHDVPLLASR